MSPIANTKAAAGTLANNKVLRQALLGQEDHETSGMTFTTGGTYTLAPAKLGAQRYTAGNLVGVR